MADRPSAPDSPALESDGVGAGMVGSATGPPQLQTRKDRSKRRMNVSAIAPGHPDRARRQRKVKENWARDAGSLGN
ncbi:hypothetical protein GCM10009835_01550 [Planosporangium flavigriseum]